jgi:hypothetical protein
MKLALNIAEKLMQLVEGQKIPASKMKYAIVQDLMAEGIIYRPGKVNSIIQLTEKQQLELYLKNHFEINDLRSYIEAVKNEESTRADLVVVAADSKVKAVRTFKGFLVNSYTPISTTLNGESHIICPTIGTFNFIYDFEGFIPTPDVTIVGIENPENFRHIEKQQYLFKDIKPLFVSRYPQNQSKDLIKWLQSIPNNYMHFGDFDFAGIGIYLNEFQKYIGERGNFFVPNNIEELIIKFGSKKRYDIQKANFNTDLVRDDKLLRLIKLLHICKKGLDQEILIRQNNL